jgi:hypothetical protein
LAFDESQEFWRSISSAVSDEGYTSAEGFGKGIQIFQQLRESGLSTLLGKEREEFDRQTQWVMNLGK